MFIFSVSHCLQKLLNNYRNNRKFERKQSISLLSYYVCPLGGVIVHMFGL